MVIGPMNTGTNLVKKILSSECIDNITKNNIIMSPDSVLFKHTIQKNEINNFLSKKDNLLIIMYKNVFNWVYSMKKANYEVKFTKLNDKVELLNTPFKNIIDLYNHYYKMYIQILQESDNVIFLDYYKIIQKNTMFNYMNKKLSRLNISLRSEKNVKQILDTPSKGHGQSVNNSDSALGIYLINQKLVSKYLIKNTNIYGFISKKIMYLFENKK